MPRRARMYLSGLPYHVVQRGNNREVCFTKEAHCCLPIVDDRFRQQIKQKYNIRLGLMEQGRPRKELACCLVLSICSIYFPVGRLARGNHNLAKKENQNESNQISRC